MLDYDRTPLIAQRRQRHFSTDLSICHSNRASKRIASLRGSNAAVPNPVQFQRPHGDSIPTSPNTNFGREKRAGTLAPTLYLSGSPTWIRTRDLRINSPSLYRLSYQGMKSADSID